MNANMKIREWLSGDWRVDVDAIMASPERAQQKTLMRILKAQANSSFGKTQHFDAIDTVEAFRAQVPLSNAMTLRSTIDLQRGNQTPVLTCDQPVLHLGGSQKGHITPVTASELALRRRMAGFLSDELGAEGGSVEGKIMDLTALDGFYADQRSPLSYDQVLSDSPDLSQVEDLELRGYLIALMALANGTITTIHAPDLASISVLLEIIDRHRDTLLSDLVAGSLSVEGRVNAEIASAVLMRCEASQARLRKLRGLLADGVSLQIVHLWPSLRRVLSDASRDMDAAPRAVPLPADIRVIDLGCWTNEAILTLPQPFGATSGVPAVHDVFYEFAGADSEEMLGLHEIGEGRAYRIFVTTGSGLYRFALPVLAEVVGWSGQYPLLQMKRVAGPTSGRRRPMPTLRQAASIASSAVEVSGTGSTFCRVSTVNDCGHFRITLPGTILPICLSSRLAAMFDQQLRSRSLYYDRMRTLGALPLVEVCNAGTAAAAPLPQMSCSVA